ncbi:MAG: PEP-CTERM sorting domain-containing protein [Planctomycetota bacterium]
MKTRCLVMGLASASLFAAGANAAFVVEATGGLASGTNFGFGGDTTAASSSVPSTAVGLTSSNSLFGGNGSNGAFDAFDPAIADTYVFSYTPGTDADNFSPAAGTVLGSTDGSPGDGNLATGLAGGATGRYNVYFTSPASTNVATAGSTITATNDGSDVVLNPVDLNSGGTGPDTQITAPPPGGVIDFVGGANNAWELIGTVDLTSGVTYTVTFQANANFFVSQRAHAVMWEAVPEPATVSLLGLGALAMLRRRSA